LEKGCEQKAIEYLPSSPLFSLNRNKTHYYYRNRRFSPCRGKRRCARSTLRSADRAGGAWDTNLSAVTVAGTTASGRSEAPARRGGHGSVSAAVFTTP